MEKHSLTRRLTKCQLALTASLAAIVLGLSNEQVILAQETTNSEATPTVTTETAENTDAISEPSTEEEPSTSDEIAGSNDVTETTISKNEEAIPPLENNDNDVTPSEVSAVADQSENKASESTAITVAEAKVKPVGEKVTIEGYIVGTLKSSTAFSDAHLKTNLAIADTKDAEAKDSFLFNYLQNLNCAQNII